MQASLVYPTILLYYEYTINESNRRLRQMSVADFQISVFSDILIC